MPNRTGQLKRFEQFGLKWNPFRLVAQKELADVYVPDLHDSQNLASQISGSRIPVTQIIARTGHGKSTLLLAVRDELESREVENRLIYIEPAMLSRVALPSEDVRVLILDEAERLTKNNFWRLIRWTSDGRRLVFSTHNDLLRDQSRSDFTSFELPQLTAENVVQFFETRCKWASISADLTLDSRAAEWLVKNCGGNIRIIEAVFYEAFQTRLNLPAESLEQGTWHVLVDDLEWLGDFARRRVANEELGNVPFSRTRLVKKWLLRLVRKPGSVH